MQSWLVPLVSAIGGGLLTSLVAPFIKWDIEKRKLRRQARINKIKFWRSEAEAHTVFRDFIDTSTFNELRNRFTKEELNSFSNVWESKYEGINKPWDRGKFLKIHDAIDTIEREWKII